MSVHFSVIAIEGDHRSDLDSILGAYGYAAQSSPEEKSDWQSVEDELSTAEDSDPEILVVAHNGRWTMFTHARDALFRMVLAEDIAETLANGIDTRVFGALGDGISCTYGWYLFGKGHERRVYVADNLFENEGDPLPGEPEVDRELYNEESIFDVTELLGFDLLDGFEALDSYLLVPVGPATVEIPDVPKRKREFAKRPWWKCW